MKSKNLILGGAVIVLLVGAIVALSLTGKDKQDNNSQTSSETTTYTMVKESSDNITAIKIENKKDNYQINKINSQDDTETWGVDDISKLPQDQAKYQSFISSVLSIECYIKLTNPSDLNKYGFGEEKSSITYFTADGGTKQLYIGNKTIDENGYYCMEGNKQDVYVLPAGVSEKILDSKLQFIDTVLTPTFKFTNTSSSSSSYSTDNGSQTPLNYVQKIEVSRPDLEKPIILVKSKADEPTVLLTDLEMSSPVKSSLESSKAESLKTNISGFMADEAIAVYPSKQDLEKYGFNNPTAVVTYVVDNKTYQLIIGKGIEYEKDSSGEKQSGFEKYYIMLKGSDIIYTALNTNLPWVNIRPEEYIPKTVISPTIADVASIEVKSSDNVYTSKISGSDDDLTATVNDVNADTQNFKKYFQLLASIPTAGINTDANLQGNVILMITYKYKDKNKTDDVIEIISTSSNNVIMKLNGNPCFIGKERYAEKILSESQNIINNKTVDSNY